NAAQAEAMADASTRQGRVLMEAFHYRYHPLFGRLRTIITSGEIGRVQHLDATFCIPLLRAGDIRWRADLAGGALMDTCCAVVHLLRDVAGAEPTVQQARASWTSRGVDRWLRAEMVFPSGATGRITCGLLQPRLLSIRARVVGTEGRIDVFNFVAPQFL